MNRKRVAVLAAVIAAALIVGAGSHGAAGPSPHIRGNGWVAVGNPDSKAHFRAELPCAAPASRGGEGGPAIFEWSWGESSFKLDRLDRVACGNNLHEGSGVGSCGDEAGLIINWRLLDGERDGRDFVEVSIGNPNESSCSLSYSGALGGGQIKMIVGPEY